MRKVTQMRRRGRKRLFTVILYLCLLLAVIFIVFVKTFELKELEIEGNTRYTAQELEELLMTKPTDRVSVLFWLRMKWWGADPIPFVEKVETDWKNRSVVRITVHEKRITGCVMHRGSYLYFDRDGIVVESSRIKPEDIPVITGLNFSRIVLHEQLKVQKEEMFTVILNLARLIEKQELIVEEIRFRPDDAVELRTQGCEVILGKRQYYDEVLAVLGSVLESAEGRRLRIDMTLYENGNNRITAQPLEEETQQSP